MNTDFEVFVLDGFDVCGETIPYLPDGRCELRVMQSGAPINGSQRLAVGLPSR